MSYNTCSFGRSRRKSKKRYSKMSKYSQYKVVARDLLNGIYSIKKKIKKERNRRHRDHDKISLLNRQLENIEGEFHKNQKEITKLAKEKGVHILSSRKRTYKISKKKRSNSQRGKMYRSHHKKRRGASKKRRNSRSHKKLMKSLISAGKKRERTRRRKTMARNLLSSGSIERYPYRFGL